jgi:hypothetical protein
MVWFVIVIFSLPPQTDKWSQSVFKHPAVTQDHVVVDVVCFQLLRGSTVDFSTKFISSSFHVVNKPQVVGSGCGCDINWKKKADEPIFSSHAFIERRK